MGRFHGITINANNLFLEKKIIMSGVMEEAEWLNSLGLTEIKETNVCWRHIDDYAIKAFIKKKSVDENCTYCNARKSVSFESLMLYMMPCIMNHYTDAAEFMPYDSEEGGYIGSTYSPDELIDDMVGLTINNDELREDIISSIDDRAWSDPNTLHDSEREKLTGLYILLLETIIKLHVFYSWITKSHFNNYHLIKRV